MLTWKPKANSRQIRQHPDTRESHLVIYNNHGLRQHRDVTQEEVGSSVVISVFGDSYATNRNLPIQYGFTETLDYLLNIESDHDNYLVLNFGVSGYGTDQEFIKYKTTPLARHSAHVFYVLCGNDLGDIYNNGLFTNHNGKFFINGGDTLAQLPAKKPNELKLFLQNFYLTYLILDAKSGFETFYKPITQSYAFDTKQLRKDRKKRKKDGIAKQKNKKLGSNEFGHAARSMGIMNTILDQWRSEVEENGGVFHIIILPNREAHNIAAHFSKELTILDLYEVFTDEIKDYKWREMTFKNDGHWAEIGNMYAAIAIKQYLKNEELDLNGIAETYSHLDCYYQAFGNQWRPKNLPQSKKCKSSTMAWVRNRYIPLEFLEK